MGLGVQGLNFQMLDLQMPLDLLSPPLHAPPLATLVWGKDLARSLGRLEQEQEQVSRMLDLQMLDLQMLDLQMPPVGSLEAGG